MLTAKKPWHITGYSLTHNLVSCSKQLINLFLHLYYVHIVIQIGVFVWPIHTMLKINSRNILSHMMQVTEDIQAHKNSSNYACITRHQLTWKIADQLPKLGTHKEKHSSSLVKLIYNCSWSQSSHISLTETRNWYDWQRPMEIIQSNPPAGSPWAGDTGTHTGGFWISPDRENSQAPWAAYSKCYPHTKWFLLKLKWNLLHFSLWPLLLILSLGIAKKFGTILFTPAFEVFIYLNKIPSQCSFLLTEHAQLPQPLFERDVPDPWILSSSSFSRTEKLSNMSTGRWHIPILLSAGIKK